MPRARRSAPAIFFRLATARILAPSTATTRPCSRQNCTKAALALNTVTLRSFARFGQILGTVLGRHPIDRRTLVKVRIAEGRRAALSTQVVRWGCPLAGTCPLQASPATCCASVARYRQPREKRSVRGEPAGYELSEEPHALRLACLPLREKPERSVHVQVGARRPHQ